MPPLLCHRPAHHSSLHCPKQQHIRLLPSQSIISCLSCGWQLLHVVGLQAASDIIRNALPCWLSMDLQGGQGTAHLHIDHTPAVSLAGTACSESLHASEVVQTLRQLQLLLGCNCEAIVFF